MAAIKYYSSCFLVLKSSDIKVVIDVPTADEAIRKMFTGVKCPLEPYKDLSAKVLLLDSAIKFKDGNLITQVYSVCVFWIKY